MWCSHHQPHQHENTFPGYFFLHRVFRTLFLKKFLYCYCFIFCFHTLGSFHVHVCVFVCLCFLSKSIHIFSRPTASHPTFNGLEQLQWGYVLPTVVALCRPSTLDRRLLYCIVLVIFPLSVQLNVAVS